MTTDPRPRSQEFVVWSENGKLAFVCEDLYDGRWRMEWRSHRGQVLFQIPWTSQDTPDLHLKIRDAHRLEYPDLDPDFVTLGECHAICGGSHGAADHQEIELAWIFSAIGRALKRESPGDSEFLSGIAETAATYLEERGPYWRLAHPKRRRRGKPTERDRSRAARMTA
jgi:hypothetical protein